MAHIDSCSAVRGALQPSAAALGKGCCTCTKGRLGYVGFSGHAACLPAIQKKHACNALSPKLHSSQAHKGKASVLRFTHHHRWSGHTAGRLDHKEVAGSGHPICRRRFGTSGSRTTPSLPDCLYLQQGDFPALKHARVCMRGINIICSRRMPHPIAARAPFVSQCQRLALDKAHC